ncbi:MAG: NUDIX hydrolase [Actinobacteria bacterium]|nr:NUDIX hydrolase [Actinomycetota bacterium]
MTVEPRHAASVIVLRDSEEGMQILFVRRSPDLKFMGGAWVFPGGAVAEEDGERISDDLRFRKCGVRETQEESGIVLPDPLALVPFSRWITPEPAPIRFDTRFYLVRSPNGAEPAPDRREVDRAEWWTPAEALDKYVRETAELHFPTIKQVERLAPHAEVDTALDEASKSSVEPILPRVAATDDGFEILLPGDPGYDKAI